MKITKNKILIAMVASILALTGCVSNINDNKSEDITHTDQQATKSELDLYNAFVVKNENWMFSPYSLKDAFSLLYNGADGVTKTEFETVLGLNTDKVFNIRDYDESIKNTTNSIKIANKAYITNDSTIQDKINTNILKLPEDTIKELNVSNPKEAADEINLFVSDTTNNKINNFIDPDNITPDSVLLLVNALYFNKTWNFEESSIRWSDEKYYKAFQDTNYSLNKIKEIDDGNIDVLRLNYDKDKKDENDYAMTIFCKSMNAEKNNVDEYLASIAQETFDEIMNFKTYQGLSGYDKATFYVPNFEFENKFSLMNDLKQIGMLETFSSSEGFSKIGPVKISDVIQATYIKTDRNGTEAAAATGIGMKMSANIDSGKTKVVTANDDFVFVISDTTTDTILFIGRVTKPTDEI